MLIPKVSFLKLRHTLSLIVGLLVLSFKLSAAQLLVFEGKAHDIVTDVLLYAEEHKVIIGDDGRYVSAYVSYRDPQGQLFAEKVLDYTKSQLMPEMLFHDKRNDDRIRVSLSDELSRVNVLLESETDREENSVSIPSKGVIDAGFDRFIIENWSSLAQGRSLDFEFLAITRGQFFEFTFDDAKTKNNTLSLALHPSNFFLNMLVDPLYFQYDIKTMRLIRFQGLTNIQRFEAGKATGKNYQAIIRYQYQPLKPYYLQPVISLKTLEYPSMAQFESE